MAEQAAYGGNRIKTDLDRKIIPYFYFWADTTLERMQELIEQFRPWGIQVYAYPRNDHLQKLDARAYVGYWVGPGSGPSMQRIYDFSVVGGRIKILRQVISTPAQWAAVGQKYQAGSRLLQQQHRMT